MRYAPDHKHKTRERVLRSAARALRRSGPEKLGVAQVMQSAGLTHGGFYAHFASKDELVVDAIDAMFRDALANFDSITAGKPAREAMAAYVQFYLSPGHCHERDSGCPMAALATDIPRMEAKARRAFEHGSARLATAIADKLGEMHVGDAGEVATSLLSELVGALVLARCITDEGSAAMLLKASRSQIMKRLGAP